MSTNNSQQTPSGGEKTCRCASKASLVIWILLLLVIAAVLWGIYTDSGQQTMGNISNKGFFNWLLGEGNIQVENDAAAALEKSGVIIIKEGDKGVTSLNFSDCLKPGDETLKQVAKVYHLQTAILDNVEITDDQLAYLGKLNHLTSLVISGTPISDAGLVHLLGLPAIQMFNANRTKITDKGLEQLAKIPSLTMLDLSYTGIGDPGMKQLAQLKNLNWLLIKGNKITDAGLAELASISELKRLTLSNDMKISSETIEQIKKKLPNLQVDLEQPDSPAAKPADEKPADATPPPVEAENKSDAAAAQ